MFPPGATICGLRAPSELGPQELKKLIYPPVSVFGELRIVGGLVVELKEFWIAVRLLFFRVSNHSIVVKG